MKPAPNPISEWSIGAGTAPNCLQRYGLESRVIIKGWLPELGMDEIDRWAQEHKEELEQA